jgi:drug/metabolite transporter (DMT)-like permease
VRSLRPTQSWSAALAAIGGSGLVGVMPLAALHLYADGLSPASMLFWRYVIAIIALAAAAALAGLKFSQAWRDGAWRVVLLGATLGAGQTLCFWESIKTLETSIAVLLFYTYPALTLILDRLVFRQNIRPRAVFCIAIILLGAALITLPGLRSGTLDLGGLAWAIPSPLVYAFYLAINARLLRRHPPLIGAGALFFGMALSFAAEAAWAGLEVPTSIAAWLLVLFAALGPGALTVTLFSYSVPRLGASGFAILANTELVTVVLIGVVVLGEAVTTGRLIGGALIVTGIAAHALSRQTTSLPLPASALRATAPSPAMGERVDRSPQASGG